MLKNMLKLWEVARSNVYTFDGGGIKSRIEVIHEGLNFSYLRSLFILVVPLRSENYNAVVRLCFLCKLTAKGFPIDWSFLIPRTLATPRL